MAEEPGTPDSTQASDEALSAAANRATVASARVARWSAIIAAVAVVVAAGSAFYSSYLAQQQNNSTQRQELVSLIGDIAQGQQASGTTNGNAISSQLLVLGEAEEANKIIEDLSGVSQVEKYLVGSGLQYGQDYQDAQNLFTEAADENTVPRVTADSWRGAAASLYALDSDQAAENDINAAEKANGSPTGLAYTYLFDIPYRAAISDCSTASGEWRQAAQLTQKQHNTLTGSNAMTAEKNAKTALVNVCKMTPAALEKIYISGSSSTQT
ncbi:MAG TPA: hypothetical protein VMC83_32040 [Streptosporangiaceae bacterium]|nr:hypothetical protein [Streptosporangiaceae bacterium]